MDDDLIQRFESYKNVWSRVTEISAEATAGNVPASDAPPEYGSFCLVPDPDHKSSATRFLPGL